MRVVVEDVAAGLPYAVPWVAAQLASCEAELTRLEATPDPDRWALAAAAWDALGIPYERAYALMREGEAAVERRDRARAKRALREADAIAVRLGAWPLRRAVERLATPAGMVPTPADPSDSAPPQSLTPVLAMDLTAPAFAIRYQLTRRESEVLGLVAEGRSNSEIGDLLFISRKTVAVHLANVKAKLGATSRVEMALMALESGFVGDRTSRHGRVGTPGGQPAGVSPT
jgi:DNA-binding CsgD family transcriptional regulator